MNELMLKVDNVSKQYKLGQIGGTTLREELQRLTAKMRGKEDPTKKIGAKDYNRGETFMALDGVSFEVKKGERVGIIGHNGAGKSTLLKLISRVTAPTGGTIGLNGRVASMLEVGTGFHAELTGRENIYMNGAILGMTKKEIDAKIEDIIDFSEVRKFIDTPVKRYSSGMYVKLAFSVAAHLDSEIMIMDEVLAVGDMAFQKKCIEKMSDVSKEQGRTILYVSHNMNTIRQLCDRVIVLKQGKAIYDGEVEEGILTYLDGKIESNAVEYDCTEMIRNSLSDPNKIFMTRIAFDHESNIFSNDLPIRMTVEFDANDNVGEVQVFSTVFSLNGDRIGMIQTVDSLCVAEKGRHYICHIKFTLNNLIEGAYFIAPSIYGSDNSGNLLVYDAPVCKIIFQISNKVKNGLRWSSKVFGFISFDPIEIEDTETQEIN